MSIGINLSLLEVVSLFDASSFTFGILIYSLFLRQIQNFNDALSLDYLHVTEILAPSRPTLLSKLIKYSTQSSTLKLSSGRIRSELTLELQDLDSREKWKRCGVGGRLEGSDMQPRPMLHPSYFRCLLLPQFSQLDRFQLAQVNLACQLRLLEKIILTCENTPTLEDLVEVECRRLPIRTRTLDNNYLSLLSLQRQDSLLFPMPLPHRLTLLSLLFRPRILALHIRMARLKSLLKLVLFR